MKLTSTNISFRHNSDCVIQKWLRLAHTFIFPNESKINQLLFKFCILMKLLKTGVLNSH